TAKANDIDSPPSSLRFSLDNAPAGAAINPKTGVFNWTPSEEQGPQNFTFSVRVTDDGNPPLSDTKTINIQVNEVNVPPRLTSVPASTTINELEPYSFIAKALDPDIPVQTLTFSLANAPAGATIDPGTGVFNWTPSEAEGDGSTYKFVVRVSDGVAST